MLGVVIVKVVLTLTPINTLMGQQVSLDLLQEPPLALWLVGVALAMGLLSGVYPAFYLSSWAPLTALTGKQTAARASLRLREALVLLQFTISAAVIACTLLMVAQMRYVANKPLGFERDNRLMVSLRGRHDHREDPDDPRRAAGGQACTGVAVARLTPADGGTPA